MHLVSKTLIIQSILHKNIVRFLLISLSSLTLSDSTECKWEKEQEKKKYLFWCQVGWGENGFTGWNCVHEAAKEGLDSTLTTHLAFTDIVSVNTKGDIKNSRKLCLSVRTSYRLSVE